MPKLNLQQKLEKVNISAEHFAAENAALIALGYTAKQAERLIITKSSANTIATLLRTHAWLITHLTHEQIVSIAGHKGGAKNIQAVQAAFASLTALGFKAEQIVRLAGHNGGAKNIAAVQTGFEPLRAFGFNPEQILMLAWRIGGAKNIAAIQAAFDSLRALNFNAEQIMRLARHPGSAKNITAIQTACEYLRALNFNAEQIVRLAGSNGGSKNIEAIIKNYDVLCLFSITPEALINLLSYWRKDRENLLAVLEAKGLLPMLDSFDCVAEDDGDVNDFDRLRQLTTPAPQPLAFSSSRKRSSDAVVPDVKARNKVPRPA